MRGKRAAPDASPLPPGKLPTRLLDRLLKRYAPGGPGVVIGPSIGIDAAVIDLEGTEVVVKSDPVTFVSDNAGTYAVFVNANDIAVMGGVPRWFLATVLLPSGKATARMAEGIFSQMSKACRCVGAALCGGHTEITTAVDRPVVSGHMLGTLALGRPVTAAGARGGDAVLLTKGIAIEATAIMARELKDRLKAGFSAAFIRRCERCFIDPGISVVRDAAVAMSSGRVHAMHDPTEGGLSAALHELSAACGRSVTVERALIPVLPETQALCGFFGIDPMGAISSGALLVAAPAPDAGRIVAALREEGIGAAIIGRVGPKGRAVRIKEGNRLKNLKYFERDELTRILV